MRYYARMKDDQPITLAPLDADAERRRVAGGVFESWFGALVESDAAQLFRIDAAATPGLVSIGSVITLEAKLAASFGAPVLSASGKGESQTAALGSCLGEAAELVASIERAGDLTLRDDARRRIVDGWIGDLTRGRDRAIDHVVAREATRGEAVALPADLCLRRAAASRVIAPPAALSSGVAAGATRAEAVERAVMELIERDAAAMWWLAGATARLVAADEAAAVATAGLSLRLRGGRARATTLVDITTELGVPVAAAWSTDAEGRDLSFGVACRGTLAEAAGAALLEMAQMETAATLSALKRAGRGEAALNAIDRANLARAGAEAASLAPLRAQPGPAPADAGEGDLIARLASRGVDIFLVDLTRAEIGAPVMRAVSPDLQPFSARVRTRRFAAQVDRTGGAGAPPHVSPF